MTTAIVGSALAGHGAGHILLHAAKEAVEHAWSAVEDRADKAGERN